MFQDAMAVALMNTTTKVYNDICGKVLRHRPNFPISELACFEREDMDEQGKSLVSPVDTMMRLKWELNEDGVLIWPSFVLEERGDLEGLLRFDSWVAGVLEAKAKPFSSPPTSQPVTTLARSSPASDDASVHVHLMDD
ncbi:hypothetical protein SLEP1_g29976 [Rubroshorea leprosula]|uniref:Uncharacterized protein n=1 Tax=Rubroshorea leprosula TaxID=152421 RepID=A0AAV5K4Q6_9ROSI|nr:hypothetical protein SLEP1_g29976 [Rubroshorea leprosula]